MGKLLVLVLIGTLVAAFLVPYRGLTLFDRMALRMAPAAVQKKRVATPAPVRRERTRPAEPPKERLSDGDRKALDRLVSESRTETR